MYRKREFEEPQWAKLIEDGVVRSATLEEYVCWLREYVKRGGKPTHEYNYSWPKNTFLTALQRFEMDDECGAHARSIILPATVGPALSGKRGRNNLYIWTDVSCYGIGWVPIYSDSAFDEFRGLAGYKAPQESIRRPRRN